MPKWFSAAHIGSGVRLIPVRYPSIGPGNMVAALTQADLIFPTQTISISSTLHELKRSALSIHNRLRSITSDAEFVTSISAAYGLPLVANERCGSWYIPTEKKVESVYFKSTDGHTNEWSFSLRRLNLQLIDVIGKFGGWVASRRAVLSRSI